MEETVQKGLPLEIIEKLEKFLSQEKYFNQIVSNSDIEEQEMKNTN